jgi:hypothetical protein
VSNSAEKRGHLDSVHVDGGIQQSHFRHCQFPYAAPVALLWSSEVAIVLCGWKESLDSRIFVQAYNARHDWEGLLQFRKLITVPVFV